MKRLIDNVSFSIIGAAVSAAVLYLCAPIVVSIAMSFDSRPYLGPFPPPSISLKWYAEFFSNSYYLDGLRTSLVIAALSTLISSILGVAAALALDQYEFRGKAALSTLFLSPLVVPAVVLGFSLLMFFSFVGIYEPFPRLVGGHIMVTIPYTIRTTLAAMGGIRKSLIEAANTLGATEFRAFWDVTLPLARTGIVAGAVFAFAFSLDDVAVSMFLAGPDAYTLPIALISMMRANFDLTIAAGAVVLVVFTVALIWILDRLVGLDRVIGQGVYRA